MLEQMVSIDELLLVINDVCKIAMCAAERKQACDYLL